MSDASPAHSAGETWKAYWDNEKPEGEDWYIGPTGFLDDAIATGLNETNAKLIVAALASRSPDMARDGWRDVVAERKTAALAALERIAACGDPFARTVAREALLTAYNERKES